MLPPVEPSVPPSAAASTASAVAPRPDSQLGSERRGGMMIWIIGGVAVALLAVWFAMSGKDDKPKSQVVQAAPVQTPAPEAEKTPPPPPPTPAPAAVVAEEEPAEEEPVEEEEMVELDEGELEEEAAVVASARTGKKRRPKADGEAPKPKAEPAQEPPPEAPAEPPPAPDPAPATDKPPVDDGKFSSDCLLNPNKPGCAEYRAKQTEKKNLDATLAEKLSTSQIRKGMTPHKNKAKACGTKHGVESGTTVHVKLSIAGETGKVLSAVATGPHAGTPVGQCVADIFKKAQFDRFKSQQQGAVYPLRM